jgi:hypothetical protein
MISPALPKLPHAAPAPGTNVKGTLILARMKYLRARGTEDAERVLRRMSSEDQQVLRGMVLPSSWYPADIVIRPTPPPRSRQGDRKLFTDIMVLRTRPRAERSHRPA